MEARDPNILPAAKKAWTGVVAAGRMAGRGARRAVRAVGTAGAVAERRGTRARPLTREDLAKHGGVVAGVGLAGAALFLMWKRAEAKKRRQQRKPPGPTQPQGRPLCPSEVPATDQPDLTGIKKGDYVIVTLTNVPGTLRESTWAEVLNVGQKVAVQLVGAQRAALGKEYEFVPTSLKTDWHGFHTGQKMFLNPNCIWDVLHTHTQPGTIICGHKGAAVAGRAPLTNRFLMLGFRVQLILGNPKGEAVEFAWATVTNISTTGSVITAEIAEAPKGTQQHGFKAGDSIQFARDCIFGVQAV